MKTDFDRYQELKRKMRKAKPFSPEFQDAWRELEQVKNRHGGMPPEKPTN